MKKLKELRTMLTQPDLKNYNLIKKLILVSLTEIFKDIVPGYKIRVWSEKENEQQVSKDIASLKEYEHQLVKQYKLFIEYLESCIKITKSDDSDEKQNVSHLCLELSGKEIFYLLN